MAGFSWVNASLKVAAEVNLFNNDYHLTLVRFGLADLRSNSRPLRETNQAIM